MGGHNLYPSKKLTNYIECKIEKPFFTHFLLLITTLVVVVCHIFYNIFIYTRFLLLLFCITGIIGSQKMKPTFVGQTYRYLYSYFMQKNILLLSINAGLDTRFRI